MSDTYSMTQAQREALGKFTCERLAHKEENLEKIKNFTVRKEGRGLLGNLINSGWGKDMRGSTAYYVIKNERGEIVLFFSLKCGTLFDPFHVNAFVDAYQDTEVYGKWKKFRVYAYNTGLTQPELNRVKAIDPEAAKFIALRDSIGEAEWFELIKELKRLDSLMEDRQNEHNQLLVRVEQDYSAIQLVDFCADDDANSRWKHQDEYGMMPQLMGETLFWWFIVPKMQQISQLIGAEFVYLFAADSSAEGTLTKYYERLHFRKLSKLGTVKPFYDLNCSFMGKRLNTLRDNLPRMKDLSVDSDIYGLDHYREEFIRNFNLNRISSDNV